MAFINKSLIPLYNYSRFCRHLVQQGKLDYSLSELMKYDFFKITIPILQKELSLSEKCIERIIAYSYVLTNDMLYDLNWLDNKCAFCDFFYIDGISWSDFQISALKDFVVLYNSWTHRYETKEYNFETSLFEHVGKLDISYELPCDIDGEFYFTLFELGMNTENKLTYDLIYEFSEICFNKLNISYGDLLLSMSKLDFKDDREITYGYLAKILAEDHISFCFLVSYVKANNLYDLDNKAVLDYLSPEMIRAFKNFWWQCDVYGKHKDEINEQIKERTFNSKDSIVLDFWKYIENVEFKDLYKQDYSEKWCRFDRYFSIGTEFSYKYNQFCTYSRFKGIDIKMSEDYFHLDVCPSQDERASLDSSFKESLKENIEGNVSDEENSSELYESTQISQTKQKRIKLLSFLSPDIDKNKTDEILDILKNMVLEAKGKMLVVIVLGAYKAGFFNKVLRFPDLKSLGIIDPKLSPTGFNGIMDKVNTSEGYNLCYYPEITTYCELFQKLKSKFSK